MERLLRICVPTLLLAALAVIPADGFLDLLVKDGLAARSQVPLYLIRNGAIEGTWNVIVGPSIREPVRYRTSASVRPEASTVRFQWNTTKQHLRYTMDLASEGPDGVLKMRPSIPLNDIVPLKRREFTLKLSCLTQSPTPGSLSIKFNFRDASDTLVYKNSPSISLTKLCNLEDDFPEDKRRESPRHAKAERPSAPVGRGVPPIRRPGPKLHKPENPLGIGLVDPLVSTTSDPATTPAMPKPTVSSTAHEQEGSRLVSSDHSARRSPPVCNMCRLPRSTVELRKIVCRSDYVIRARLRKYSSSSAESSRQWISLGLRDLRPFLNWPLMTSRLHATAKMTPPTAIGRAKLVLGKQSVACTCNGKINNKGMFLLVGKWTKRGRQLVVRHNRGMLLPWREARGIFRQARNMRC